MRLTARLHESTTSTVRNLARAIARELAAGILADYGHKYDSAMACFVDDFDACIADLRFPVTHRRAIRTTNLLERLFVEERRRRKIIPNAFGDRAVLKLMFGALIRAAERWRSIKVSEFEDRQISALRKELDQEYEPQVPSQNTTVKGSGPGENIQQSSDHYGAAVIDTQERATQTLRVDRLRGIHHVFTREYWRLSRTSLTKALPKVWASEKPVVILCNAL